MGVPYAEVIGDPVDHSKSPLIHNFWLGKLGLPGEFRKTRVTREGLGAYVAARRDDPDWRGCSVTIPHKQAVMPLLDDNCASWAGAVNCVARRGDRLIGYNTDMSGIGKVLPDHIDTHRPVCIVGAGGAARAAVAELDIAAVFQFNIIARDVAKARSLIEPYGEYGEVFPFEEADDAMRGCGGLINASPLGMEGFDSMPASVLDSVPLLAGRAFVLDMVYAPLRTELLARAEGVKSRGFSRGPRFHVADGLTVLIGQAEEAFALFFGAPAPAEHRAELRELLAS